MIRSLAWGAANLVLAPFGRELVLVVSWPDQCDLERSPRSEPRPSRRWRFDRLDR